MPKQARRRSKNWRTDSMKLQSLKTLLFGAAFALAMTAPALADDGDDSKSAEKTAQDKDTQDKDQADAKAKDAELEKQLEAARARLEAAAREVAELSGQLSGPLMARTMHPPRAMIGI